MMEEISGGIPESAVARDADTHGDGEAMFSHAKFMALSRAPDPLGDDKRGVELGIREKQRELFASKPSDKIIPLARAFGDYTCERDENLITDSVSVLIVDALEMVRVEHEEAQRSPLFLRQKARLPESIHKMAPIGDAGERVAI